ncbi:hypothetical protein ACHAXS_006799 [Conticribra weissflogii]
MNSLLSGAINSVHYGSPVGSRCRYLIRRGVPLPPHPAGASSPLPSPSSRPLSWSSASSLTPSVSPRRHRPISTQPHWQQTQVLDHRRHRQRHHRHWRWHDNTAILFTADKSTKRCFSTTSPADANDKRATASNATRVLLPMLGQNGTLSLRPDDCLADPPIAEVHILPQWRDDSLIEIVPLSPSPSNECDNDNDGDDDDVTIFDQTTTTTTTTRTFGHWQFTLHADGIATSLGRPGSHVEIRRTAGSDDDAHTHFPTPVKLIATIPEKCNLDILTPRGDIFIHGKVEGDVRLSGRTIRATKLRGHRVVLVADADADADGGGIVHASKAIEAQTVRLVAARRIRATMIHGSEVDASVTVAAASTGGRSRPLDDDDDGGGAVIDIGSLYVSTAGAAAGGSEGEARLTVDASSTRVGQSALTRVKSNHGHVSIHVIVGDSTAMESSSNEPAVVAATTTAETGMEDESASTSRFHPLVDVGGVNGSCDVLVERTSRKEELPNGGHAVRDGNVAARIHFDSLTPRSISTVTARGRVGNVHLTMDRKLVTEARLLSLASADAAVMLPREVDALDLAGEDTSDEDDDSRDLDYDGDEDVKSLLLELESMASQKGNERPYDRDGENAISIETDAYIGKWGLEPFPSNDDNGDDPSNNDHDTSLRIVQYTQGTVRNRSGEPDSRFDVRSRGKIDIAGAASQALDGFRSKSEDDSNAQSTLPLVAVATDGKIRLETLSWLGSIARRYGLEESERSGLGRQASRAPRLKGK